MLREHITSSDDFEIAGVAGTGYEVIRLVHELQPDIITLDLAMPDLDGEQALEYILSEAPRPVVIVSAQDERLAESALRAMEHGAVEFVAKPNRTSAEELFAFRARLLQALRAASEALWQAIDATAEQRTSELWSWRLEGGRMLPVPFGQEAGHETESNAAQLWSTVFLAVRR